MHKRILTLIAVIAIFAAATVLSRAMLSKYAGTVMTAWEILHPR